MRIVFSKFIITDIRVTLAWSTGRFDLDYGVSECITVNFRPRPFQNRFKLVLTPSELFSMPV